MVVDNALWWQVWWPAVLLWAGTLACVAASGVLLWSLWRAQRRRASPDHIVGTPYYFNEEEIRDLYMYLYREHRPVLQKEVEETIRRSQDAGLELKVYGQGGKVGQKFDRQTVEKYIQVADAVPVLRSVIDTLQATHLIVFANLDDGQLGRNTALDRVLTTPHPEGARLSRVSGGANVYLFLTGTFHRGGGQVDTTVLHAPFGVREDGAHPPAPPRVRMECTGQLRHDMHDETFSARCLGKVVGWHKARGELAVRPIAVFG